MKLITKNFQLNSLANSYAAAIYTHVRQQNGGDHFMVNADHCPVRVEIMGGVAGIRELVDAYYLEALKLNFQGWEAMGLATISKFMMNGSELTREGIQIWESMIADMGDAIKGDC